MGLEARPFLVKPNEDELGVLMGHCLRSEDEIVEAAYSLVSQGVRWVAVSRGEKGLILVGEKEVWTGRVTLDARAIGITAVGSGDAALGGMAVVFLENKSIESVVRWGVACGAANLLTLEPGACRLSDVERLLDEVQVHRTRSIGVS
jgi:fructose-1-phosphate kinase PfkB-like protein